MMKESFFKQVTRLLEAGFSKNFLSCTVERLLKKFRSTETLPRNSSRPSKPAVLPYVHQLSHNLKKVATRYNIPVVFSAPCKYSQLCSRVSKAQNKKAECEKRHTNNFGRCAVGVVYQIPLSCTRVYIGQTGRCVQDRLREHHASLNASPSGNLAVHVSRCGCRPDFTTVQILGKFKEKVTREILEAFCIHETGSDKCISSPSIHLSDQEIRYLLSHLT